MTAVIIALVGAVGLMGAAAIPAYIQRGKTSNLQAAVGEPNGHGTIFAMLTKMLGITEDLVTRVTAIEKDLDHKEISLSRLREDHANLKELLEPPAEQ